MAVMKMKPQSLETVLKNMQSSDPDKRASAVLAIHDMLEDSAGKAQVLSGIGKVVPNLANCLVKDPRFDKSSKEAARALKKISSASPESRKTIVPKLIENGTPDAMEVLAYFGAQKCSDINVV